MSDRAESDEKSETVAYSSDCRGRFTRDESRFCSHGKGS